MTQEEIAILTSERERLSMLWAGPSLIAAELRKPGVGTVPVECFITSRTLMANLGIDTASALLDQLADIPDPVVQRIYRMLEDISSGGVDIGNAGAREKITQLGTMLGWDAGLIAQIMAIGERPKTSSEGLFGRELTLAEITEGISAWEVANA